MSHRECRTDSIFDQENKVHFHSSVFWASLQGKEIMLVILFVCWCAGVTKNYFFFSLISAHAFFSGICQCAKLPECARLNLTRIVRCFSLYLIESGGIIESVKLNLTLSSQWLCRSK